MSAVALLSVGTATSSTSAIATAHSTSDSQIQVSPNSPNVLPRRFCDMSAKPAMITSTET